MSFAECENRIYGTSTLSPSPINTDHETITAFPPSATMTTTLSVPVTTSFLPSTYDPSLLSWNVTLSSTDVQSSIASSKSAFTAESETSSESTVKDITVKSTTLPSAISSTVLSKTTLSPSLSVTGMYQTWSLVQIYMDVFERKTLFCSCDFLIYQSCCGFFIIWQTVP